MLCSLCTSDDLYLLFLKNWKQKTFKNYFWLSLLLALCCAGSLLWASFSPLSYGGQSIEVHFLKDISKVWYLFWPLLIVTCLQSLSERNRHFVFSAWIGTLGVLSFIGIVQYFTGWPRPQPIPFEENRFHATLFLGHHLSVASILIFPFFAALDCGLTRGLQKKKLESALFFLIAFLGLICLVLTFSRTLWVALPLGIAIWGIWRLPTRKLKIALSISLCISLLLVSQYAPIKRRLTTEMGTSTRQTLWETNLEFFKQRPLLGVGWRHNIELSGYYLMAKEKSKDVFSGHAHNNFLDMLGGLGLFGTFSWLIWSAFIFMISISKLKKKGKVPTSFAAYSADRGLLCAWIVFQINGLTQVNFWEAKVQHQMAWVIAWALL